MAISTSNLIQTTVLRYMEGVATVNPAWQKCFTIRNDDEGALRIAALSGVGSPGSWTDGADITDVTLDTPKSNDGQTISYTAYATSVKINSLQLRDVPGILEMAARKLGMAVESKRAELAWSKVGDVLDGNTATITDPTTGSGIAFVATTHGRDTGTRSNKVTTALDRSAFTTVIRMAREWTNMDSQITDWADQPKVLMVPAELEATAKQIVGSEFTSSNLQLNIANSYQTDVAVAPYLTDANDWGLTVAAGNAYAQPLIFWQRLAPDFRVVIDQDNWSTRLQVRMAIGVDTSPLPDGLIGATVA